MRRVVMREQDSARNHSWIEMLETNQNTLAEANRKVNKGELCVFVQTQRIAEKTLVEADVLVSFEVRAE